ncbi:DUF6705 family protein [Chryseobacterium gossypii]|uniref:DUF6705 family protein n=1 Tax=Chryseobacterium gossypii TaxID=3231602 RepID=UPI003523B53A
MRKTLSLITIILISLLKSQTSTIDIQDDYLNQPDGFYRKDTNNLLDSFTGTYLYTNGNNNFKITLVKKLMQFNGRYYEDLIIGEYQYIENGTEKINTLSQLDTVYNNQRKHSIAGNHIITNNNTRLWPCPQCNPNEIRLDLGIMDTFSQRSARLFLRKIIVNGQQVLKVKISNINSVVSNPAMPAPKEFSLPRGEFTLIKQ